MLKYLPNVDFKVRVRDESVGGDNPFKWVVKNTEDYFKNKKSIIFSLPGAFTPTCSTYQLPDFDKLYDDFKKIGIDEIYCISVNDSFVMNAWAEKHEIENVKMIPDGSGEFTRDMNMLVWKPAQNFGYRSWRYAMVINDMEVEKLWREDGINQMGLDDDPYDITKPENLLNSL